MLAFPVRIFGGCKSKSFTKDGIKTKFVDLIPTKREYDKTDGTFGLHELHTINFLEVNESRNINGHVIKRFK